MPPSLAVLVTTTFMPTMAALAGLVPWAEDGMRQMLRLLSPEVKVRVGNRRKS